MNQSPTEKRTLPEIITRLILFLIGMAVIATGTSIFVLSDTGSDPFAVFMQGIANVLHISNGIAHMGINFTYLLVILIFARRYIKIGTVAAIFICGPIIDLVSFLLSPFLNSSLNFWIRVVIMLCGCIIMGFGLAMVINADVGVSPNDLASIVISDKTHIAFRWIRITVDLTLVTAGFLLGGVIGVGTIAGALLTGPVTQFFSPFHLKLTRRITGSVLRYFER